MSILAGMFAIGMQGPPQLDPKELECMALNIYHEARSEVVEGQIAVAHVTMNRVKHSYFPNSICDVVYQNKQFSWTWLVDDHTPHEKKAWEQSQTIARDVMIGNTVDPSKGATFYHASYVNPSWIKAMKVSKVIGLHIFYAWDGTWD